MDEGTRQKERKSAAMDETQDEIASGKRTRNAKYTTWRLTQFDLDFDHPRLHSTTDPKLKHPGRRLPNQCARGLRPS
jgi:hypothetical protein